MRVAASAESLARAHGADAEQAAAIVGQCVHCGFCAAACPTYQLRGDELDGPRGRIYLIKNLLEGGSVGEATQTHLDRCLDCRACESACPSAVPYGRLLELARPMLERKVRRRLWQRLQRRFWPALLTSRVFRPLVRLARWCAPALPGTLRRRLSCTGPEVRPWPEPRHLRRVVLLEGCVQPALAPQTNASFARLLDRVQVSTVRAPAAGCCGALHLHLGQHAAALARARRNVDAWWPLLAEGVEAVSSCTSACSAMLADYGRLLAGEPRYAARAARISALVRDPVQLLEPELVKLPSLVAPAGEDRIAYHPPCTQRNAQHLPGRVEALLGALGVGLQAFAEPGMCCGSAGAYSLLQPALSRRLLARKLGHLRAVQARQILTANVGCQMQLAAGSALPVRHWLDWLDERLPPTDR